MKPGRATFPASTSPRRSAEGTLLLLKVVGDSMINAAIADGDWVVVRQQEDAQNGGPPPAYTPILGDEASILGRVVAVLRRV